MNFHVRKKIEINHYYKTAVFHNDCIKCTTLTLQKQSLDCILAKNWQNFYHVVVKVLPIIHLLICSFCMHSMLHPQI
jgi:hypothetical protein